MRQQWDIQIYLIYRLVIQTAFKIKILRYVERWGYQTRIISRYIKILVGFVPNKFKNYEKNIKIKFLSWPISSLYLILLFKNNSFIYIAYFHFQVFFLIVFTINISLYCYNITFRCCYFYKYVKNVDTILSFLFLS